MTIVKVQIDATGTRMLCYNEQRDIFIEHDDPEVVAAAKKEYGLLHAPDKCYVEAEINGGGKLMLGTQVEAQDW